MSEWVGGGGGGEGGRGEGEEKGGRVGRMDGGERDFSKEGWRGEGMGEGVGKEKKEDR